MELVANNADKITSLIQIKDDSIKISRKATIIQQKYQIKKKPQSSEKKSGKIQKNTIPKQTGLNRLNQY